MPLEHVLSGIPVGDHVLPARAQGYRIRFVRLLHLERRQSESYHARLMTWTPWPFFLVAIAEQQEKIETAIGGLAQVQVPTTWPIVGVLQVGRRLTYGPQDAELSG